MVVEIEAIQRHYTKEINSATKMSHWERRKELELYSIERKQERYAKIYILKILEGLAINLGN